MELIFKGTKKDLQALMYILESDIAKYNLYMMGVKNIKAKWVKEKKGKKIKGKNKNGK